MKFIKKLIRKLPLEVGVLALVFLGVLQNILLSGNVSFEAFIFTNIVMLMGILLGLYGSSLVVFVINFIIVPFTIFTLFFQPVIMMVPLKLFYCFSILVYSVIAYIISQSILLRRDLFSGREDIKRYVRNVDSVTGFRNEKSFYTKYDQYMESMLVRQYDDNRQLGLVMFQIDFFEQYIYQDKAATKDVLLRIAQTLIYARYPEELFFHLDNGIFVVLMPLYNDEKQVKLWQRMNNITKIQMEQIPYKNHSSLHDITIKMGELLILPADNVDGEKALSRLHRRAEADLSAEYIV